MRLSRRFAALAALRLSTLWLVQTHFVADEYWQNLEVAHRWVFGYGYLTWEWRSGLRSVLYPGLTAMLYWSLKLTGFDAWVWLLVFLPRLLHVGFSVLTDWATLRLWDRLYPGRSKDWLYLCLGSNWFLNYCASRTVSAVPETTAITLALALFPWQLFSTSNVEVSPSSPPQSRSSNELENKQSVASYTSSVLQSLPSKKLEKSQQVSSVTSPSSSLLYLWPTALGCCIRPTVALPLFPLALYQLHRSERRGRMLVSVALRVLVTLGLLTVLDSWYYGRPTLAPLNFARFNLFSNMADHYGTWPWHWYLSSGVPSVLGPAVPPLLAALRHWRRHAPLLLPCGAMLAALSLSSHKELRLLLPALPPLLVVSAHALTALRRPAFKRAAALALALPSALLLLAVALVHQRAPLDAPSSLRPLLAKHPAPALLVLAPCHSTPLYSHLHLPVPARFLTCTPPLGGRQGYTDEADAFYQDPLGWLQRRWPGEETANSTTHTYTSSENQYHKPEASSKDETHKEEETASPDGRLEAYHWDNSGALSMGGVGRGINRPPSHVLLFDALRPVLAAFLRQHGYSLCSSLFNSFVGDGRRSQYLLVYCGS